MTRQRTNGPKGNFARFFQFSAYFEAICTVLLHIPVQSAFAHEQRSKFSRRTLDLRHLLDRLVWVSMFVHRPSAIFGSIAN
jgi:hypothetical protein